MTNNSHSSHISKAIIATLTVLFVTGMGAAATVTVGSGSQDNATIGAAIDYASSGDTIEVEDGTYNEMVLINKSSLTVKPAGDYRPVIHQDSNDWTAVHVNASDVTIEGFSIKNTNNDDSNRVRGIHGDKYSDGLTIRDVVVDGVEGPDQHPEREAYGMTLSADSTTVEDSEVKNVNAAYFAAGIRLGGDSNRKVSDGTIDNVNISNVYTGNVNQSAAILLSSIANSGETEVINSKIEDLWDSGGTAGISIGSTNGAATTPDLRIEGNDIKATTNTLPGNGAAIYVEDSEVSDLSDVEVTKNDFSGSDGGAANEHVASTPLDASGNYWGATDGPSGIGSGSGVVAKGDVSYTPWYATSDFSEDVEVVDSSGDTRAYSGTIQGAVDSAQSGDTIEVEPGTYDESVSISTANVTLESTGGADVTKISADAKEGVLIGATNVTVRGFTVTTNLDDTGSHGQSGIRVELSNAGGENIVIEDNIIEDISDDYQATGIAVNAGGSLSYSYVADNVTIRDNVIRNVSTLENSGYTSIAKGIGANERVNNLDITNNAISNIGSEYSAGAFGVSLTEDGGPETPVGPENFTIRRNDISSLTVNDNDADPWYDPNALFIGGYPNLGDDHVVTENDFNDGEIHRFSVTDADTLSATYNYWGAASGPSGEGDGSGASVSTDVTYEPWLLEAGGTEFDETIQVDGGDWSLVSVPKEADMSKSALKVDGGGTPSQTVYNAKNDSWVNPSGVAEANPLGAVFIHSDDDAALGLMYTGASQVSKQVYEGWNMIGSTKDKKLRDALTIGNSLNSFYAPDTYNERKGSGHTDFGENASQVLDATDLGYLQDQFGGSQKVSPYDGYWVKASGQATLDMSVPQPN